MGKTSSLCFVTIFTLIASTVIVVVGGEGSLHKPCNSSSISQQCGQNESCKQTNGTNQQDHCECIRDYELVNDKCVPSATTTTIVTVVTEATTAKSPQSHPRTEGSSGSSIALGLLIPTFLVILGVLIYFRVRHVGTEWIQRIRQYRQRHYGNVLVTRDEDDDDDSPIA